MNKVFVDTAAWIALLNSQDSLHAQASQVRASLRRSGMMLVTTEFVFLEVADALCRPDLRSKTIGFVNRMRNLSGLQVIPVSQELLDKGWMLYSQRSDKEWGLTDCISFVVMAQENMTQAFTSDRHFEQAGFTKLL